MGAEAALDAAAPMRSILYAEDEHQYGEIIRQLHQCVRSKFYDAVAFNVVPTWPELVASVAQAPPSVILLDLNLQPSMSESEVLQALPACASGWPPVMILTGNKYNLDLRRACILAGADDFMLKDEANRNPELLCERLYHCYLRRLRDATART